MQAVAGGGSRREGIRGRGVATPDLVIAAVISVLLAAGQVWLAASDIHLDAYARSARPSPVGQDANPALLASALAAMRRAVPNPTLVLIPGDFLMHEFARRVRAHSAALAPDDAGIATMRVIASAFERTFPHAEFAIAMGNNDAPCGDYRSAANSAYLASVARIWEPLVNRGGAAPDFAASFGRYGHYTSAVPGLRLRLVVLNAIPFSIEYAGTCAGDAAHAAAREAAWLQSTLSRSPPDERNVIMMHIPPGFDAFATQYVHGFLAWPYLKPAYSAWLASVLRASANHVAYAIAGHAHRFDFRLDGSVPIVVLGSISPIYGNNPAFYRVRVGADGALRDIDTFAYDEATAAWLPGRSFARTWGVDAIDAPSLARIHARLAADAAMRRQWNAQANGWPSDVVRRGIWGRWWRISWCAQTTLTAGFQACAGIERRVALARLALVVAALAMAAAVIVLGTRLARRDRRFEQR
jgi:hypothetical protein